MILGVYKHYKGGIYYFVGTATHTETGEKLCIYIDSQGKTWVRPSDMFNGHVEINENQLVRRFELISMPVYDEVGK
jgi:hypothetical protein